MPSTSDLRELLSSDADHALATRFPVEEVIRRGRRMRLGRRVAAVGGACAVVGVVALPFALDQTDGVDQQPSTGGTDAPLVPPEGGWVPDLPGLDLPVGDPLTTSYASGETLVVGDQTYDLGAPIMQVLDVPEGTVVITREAEPTGGPRTTLQLIGADGVATTIDTGSIWSARALPDLAGTAPTRLAWIWQASDDGSANELRSAVLGDAASRAAVPGRFNLTFGFLDGDVLASSVASETADPDLARWEPGADAVQLLASGPADGSFPLGVAGSPDPERALMYSVGTPQCTYAASLTDLTDKVWEQCEGGPLVSDPRGTLAANEVGVVDLATGAFVERFDLGSDKIVYVQQPGLGQIAATVVAWSGDDVVIRLSSADDVASTPAPGGSFTYNPAYVGVRCSASTGACERLPHPIGAVEGAAF